MSADEFLGTPSYAGEEFPRTERECEQCGGTFFILDSTLQSQPCRFCSQDCLYEWMSEQLSVRDRPENPYSGNGGQ